MQFDLLEAALAMPEVLAPVWTECCMFGLAMACYTVYAGALPYASQKGKGFGRPALKPVVGRKSMVKAEATQQVLASARPKEPVQAAKARAPDRSRAGRDTQATAEAIIAHGKEGRLDKAVAMVEALKLCDGGMCTLLYNCLLDACIRCEDLAAAIGYFDEMKAAGLVDIVSFNTMIKGRLAQGEIDQALELLPQMLASGLSANSITYHMMLNAYVQRGDRRGSWKVVEQMRSAGHSPNAVTCSILLKAVVSPAQFPDLQRIVKLADDIDQFDEVLLVSLVDASIRARSLGPLSEKMRDLVAQEKLVKLSSPTYGAMIKAYGQAKDMQRVRELWGQMLSQQVTPTHITVGCMVEALVMSGCTQEAWDLTQTLWADETQRSSVNTVIYSTILKGFAMTRQHTKVTALYEEMKQRSIPSNAITFNTILNSIARCGLMDRVPGLLEDMRCSEPQAVPDLVTYSTIIKGYCQEGNVDKALGLMQQMVTEAHLKPDEMMYNSLLDGCAKEQRLEDALRLLAEMRKERVAPSNYTLSILCKLLGRVRRLAQAFELVDSISKDYGFQPNIQVYTCLIQACFHNRQASKALVLHDQIVQQGVEPDEKTYTVLASGCLHAGAVEKAAMVVRCAFHLPKSGMQLTKAPQGVEARCLKDVLAQLRRTNAGAAQVLEAELQARPQQQRGAPAWSPSHRGGARHGA